VHVVQAFAELPLVAHKAVPELMLPQRPASTALLVQPQRHDLFGVVQNLPEEQWVLGPDQGVPVVGHQHVPTKGKTQPSPRSFQHLEQQGVLRYVEPRKFRPKIHADEENTVGEAEPIDVGHASSLAPRNAAFKENPRKSPRSELH